jgi:Monooxygenase af470-like
MRAERLTARVNGEFVLFMIGMRMNRPLHIHKWLPVVTAMTRMLKELYRHPELGFVHAESWFGRTTLMLQYWRTLEQLLAYATNREAQHLPAWRAFNRAVGTNGSVGIWHETYAIRPGQYEVIYANMPPFGLGRVGTLVPATGPLHQAADRLGARP